MLNFVIKPGKDLDQNEIDAINYSKKREWNLEPMSKDHKDKHLFALLKDKSGNILAQSQLLTINNVLFENEVFTILGIGGVIANIKGNGYGKILMKEIINYLKTSKQIGLGFTGGRVIEFYRKCGFTINHQLLKQFISLHNMKHFVNTTQECVFYIDPQNILLTKVLKKPSSYVILPRDPDW